jgi:hypothetical protein
MEGVHLAKLADRLNPNRSAFDPQLKDAWVLTLPPPLFSSNPTNPFYIPALSTLLNYEPCSYNPAHLYN